MPMTSAPSASSVTAATSGGGPEEGAPVRLKGHGGKDGQARLLLYGEHRSAHLGEVGHGLDDDEIRPGLLGGARHAGKLAVRLVKAHRAERPQQRAERPDIARNVARSRSPCGRDSRRVYLLRLRGVTELEGIGAKGVGGDHLRAGLDVGGVHALDGPGGR